jgi:hypothetical protein
MTTPSTNELILGIADEASAKHLIDEGAIIDLRVEFPAADSFPRSTVTFSRLLTNGAHDRIVSFSGLTVHGIVRRLFEWVKVLPNRTAAREHTDKEEEPERSITSEPLPVGEAVQALLTMARENGLISARGGIRIEVSSDDGPALHIWAALTECGDDGPALHIWAALTECGDRTTYEGEGTTVEGALRALRDAITPPPQLQD